MDALQVSWSGMQTLIVLHNTLLKKENKPRHQEVNELELSHFSVTASDNSLCVVQLPYWSQQYKHMTTALIQHGAESH